LNDGQIVFEVAKMNSGPLPLDICHVLVQRNLPIKSQEDAFRAMQVIVDRQLGPLPPGKDKGFATDIFLPEGSYYLQINTRNNRFYETLTMHTNPILEEIEVRDEKWNIVYSESKKEPKK